jgi:histidinol-phosphate aminotransferase
VARHTGVWLVLIARPHLRGAKESRGIAPIPPVPAPEVLRLHRNERTIPFGPGEHAAMVAAIRPDDVVRYPDTAEFVGLLAGATGRPAAGLVLFAGAESAVRAVYDLMIDPGDPVVCLHPSYHGYVREAAAHRADLRAVACPGLNLDPAAVLAAVGDDARLVLLGNPDGLGRPLPPDLIRAVLHRLERRGGLLVVDEAYHGFGAPAVDDLVGAHDQVVVLRSLSKAWGLAGVRCGYAIADPAVARMLRGVRLRNEVSGPALALARYALEHPELREAYCAEVAAGRDLLAGVLLAAGFEPLSSEANFVVTRPPAGVDAGDVRRAALHAGFALAALTADLLRITVGPPAQMAAVGDFLRSGAWTARHDETTQQPNLLAGS